MYINGRKILKILFWLLAGVFMITSISYGGIALANNWDTASKYLNAEAIGRDILLVGLPGLAQYEVRDEAHLDNPGDLIQQAFDAFAKANIGDPKALLNSQMSYLQLVGADRSTPLTQEEIIFFERDYSFDDMLPEGQKDLEIDQEQIKQTLKVTGEPLVAIYNSHNGETYTPDAGTPRIDGINGGVVQVAEMLAKTLEEEYSIPTVRSEKIHDYPSYALSYANSLKTVEEILKQHPSVEIVIDVHRDYLPTHAQTTATINGQDVARILFIVGNDARQTHPNWRQNLAFVNSIEKKMEEMYPSLSRGVRQQDGRYNQHLHPKAILVEMGSAENSLAEAERSAEMLAVVIKEMLLD
ncbi:MAG: stage II sporulation protein P, partial [Bacillota bacterium]|nr:stage II sporulation protein P [Bacillota bacterium]